MSPSGALHLMLPSVDSANRKGVLDARFGAPYAFPSTACRGGKTNCVKEGGEKKGSA